MSEINNFDVGIDCVEISRFEDLRSSTIKKLFTSSEIAYCCKKARPAQHFAARFAGKEAVIKAAQSYNLNLDLSKIEILNDRLGNPYVRLVSDLASSFDIKISLSHSESIAIAVVNFVKRQ